MTLRPYQQRAVDASMRWMRSSVDPFLVDAATGAGKSHMIAAVAHQIHSMTGKRVLCLAPSAELVVQNTAKYVATGNPCSVFSASAGSKSLRHPVVFGSPLTVKNRISRFCQPGDDGYALVVVDECHGMTPTVQAIIASMRNGNPRLRVMGLTATPYRLGEGYIFRLWPDGRPNGEWAARGPYFMKCVDRVTAPELIEQGYLTPPRLGNIHVDRYDTSGLTLNARGQFDAGAVDRAYHGHGRKTAAIVGDVVIQAQDRRGVMLFAATVQHAQEVLASLPPQLSAIVTAETKRTDRETILRRFKAGELKYLVNVSVLTTGFDAPHVDLIAILRKTESVGLLQQIIGRGLRLHEGKTDCLVLDYTDNIDTHCLDGDLWTPVIRARKAKGDGGDFPVTCEWCGTENTVSLRPEYIGKDGNLSVLADSSGYAIDLIGNRIVGEHGPMPVHFGRRCFGMVRGGNDGQYVRCKYRWTSKECPTCQEPNDIAARYCFHCKAEIVDPNEKLVSKFKAFKEDPRNRQTDRIVTLECKPGTSRMGNKTLRLDITTEWRSFSIWLLPEANHYKGMRDWQLWQSVTSDGTMPTTVTYQKGLDAFYRVLAWNEPADQPTYGIRDAAE